MAKKTTTPSREALDEELRSLRAELVETKNQIRALEHAPLPVEEAVARAEHGVDQVAARLDPFHVPAFSNPTADPGETVTRLVASAMLNGDGLAHILCAVVPDQMKAFITRAIEMSFTDELSRAAVPAAQRPGRLQAFQARALSLEIEEERLVLQGERAGFEIERRENASPEAVLTTHLAEEDTAA
jgi:hypothetical protein